MSNIIYQRNAGELIPQGERTVSTFPSGLIRVDQSFIGATSNKEIHRSLLEVGNDMPGDQYPSIDALKIYPAVQEKRMADGFTEYIVSAFGRTSSKAGDLETKRIEVKFDQDYGYTYLKTTGKATVPVGEAYTFKDTGLQGDYYPSNPFSKQFVYTYHRLHLINSYQRINYLKTYDDYGNEIKLWENRYRLDAIVYAPGDNISANYPGITFGYIESEVAYLATFIDPHVFVLARRNFGSFDEIDFTTTILKEDLVGGISTVANTVVTTTTI